MILNAKPLKTEAWACDLENDSEKKGRYDMVIYGWECFLENVGVWLKKKQFPSHVMTGWEGGRGEDAVVTVQHPADVGRSPSSYLVPIIVSRYVV